MIATLLRALGIGSSEDRTIEEVDVKRSFAATSNGQALLIDVREVSEWKANGVPLNAHTVALSDPDLVAKISVLAAKNPDHPVLISCLSGTRAAKAIAVLGMGDIENLKLVTGGFQAWQAEGLPVEPYQAD